MKNEHVIATRLVAVAFLTCASAGAHAQGGSERPVRLIVPFSPGGTSDLMGRVVAAGLSDVLGTTFVVDNRGGGGGTIGAALCAQANPDGYTLLVPHVGLAVNETLYPRKPYNALKDLAPISRLGETPNGVVVRNSLPVKTMRDLVALAKAQPGKITASSAGVGSAAHLALGLLEYQANIKFTHVPFKGGGPSMIAIMGGEIDFSIPAYPTAVPHIAAGKLKLLAVTGAKREPSIPDVPTVAESGVPGYEFDIWFALFAPAGTPPAIIQRLNQAVVKALAVPETRQKLARTGVNAGTSTPEELRKHLVLEVDKWAKVVKAAGIPIN
jgi:tripartite-type tricarboxylate transporter receptor subunit TctC